MASMYMIEPPKALYARPIMTPDGGIESNSLDSLNFGSPKYFLMVSGSILF